MPIRMLSNHHLRKRSIRMNDVRTRATLEADARS